MSIISCLLSEWVCNECGMVNVDYLRSLVYYKPKNNCELFTEEIRPCQPCMQLYPRFARRGKHALMPRGGAACSAALDLSGSCLLLCCLGGCGLACVS